MTQPFKAERRKPWPPGAYATGDPAWVDYMHQAYYLLGMLWAVGRGEQAIAALCAAAPDQPSLPRLP